MLTVYQAHYFIPSSPWDLLEAEMSALMSSRLRGNPVRSKTVQLLSDRPRGPPDSNAHLAQHATLPLWPDGGARGCECREHSGVPGRVHRGGDTWARPPG